jgi:ubiquinone/menaquinone biosynthesis C-methylase UbiE
LPAKPQYALGHDELELERLKLQGQTLDPYTRRMIHDCGIQPGMRVLDIGSGVGDVTMLLAETVGPSGAVVGIDRGEAAVLVARNRATQAGYGQIMFAVGSDEDFMAYAPFDAVVARYVLIHQPDPGLMVRRAADALRPGGILAFHETAIHIGTRIMPAVALWQDMFAAVMDYGRIAYQRYDAVDGLIRYFEDAGLPTPTFRWDVPAGGSASPYIGYWVKNYQKFLPDMERLGLLREGVGNPATLHDRLTAAVNDARALFTGEPQVSAWAVKP